MAYAAKVLDVMIAPRAMSRQNAESFGKCSRNGTSSTPDSGSSC